MKLLTSLTLAFILALSGVTSIAQAATLTEEQAKLKDFFRGAKYKLFTVNPSGTAVAFIEPKLRTYDLIIYDLVNMKADEPITFQRAQQQVNHRNGIMSWENHFNKIYEMKWLSDNFLSLRQHSNDRFHRYVLVEFADRTPEGSPAFRLSFIKQNGYWVDTLPNQPTKAIYASFEPNEDYDYHVDLFKLDISKKITRSDFRKKLRLNKSGPKLHEWIFDARGWRLAGTREVGQVTELFARTGSKPRKYRYKKVFTTNVNDHLSVVGGNKEGTELLVLTNHDSDKIKLKRFNIEQMSFTDTVFEHDAYDLTGAITHPETKDVIGVSFVEKGMTKQVYFSDDYSKLASRLKSTNDIDGVYAIGMDASGDNMIFVADDSANPGKTFYYNRQTDAFSPLVELYPWLNEKNLAKTKLLQLETEDGVTLEAFLTIPDVENPPLVVIPHGGPIGISDSRHYSGNIQVLVDAGYATLQVNYRGSYGYGKAFLKQGMQQWGRLIEDDIELALQHTKDNYPVNKDKVCIIGGSYGGYSALYSIIRSPELYECAASFAGVTDLALRFQRSDLQDDDTVRALTDIMGDPTTQQKQLFSYSPLYQYKKITKPVFIAHGTDDTVVDIEHAYRLHFAMKDSGIDHEWMVLDDVGHGFHYTPNAAVYYHALIKFLDKHLKQSAVVANTN